MTRSGGGAPGPVSAPSMQGRRIGLAGPMLGGNRGWVISQHEILAGYLRAEGAVVHETSRHPQRVLRLVDTLVTIARWRGKVDCVVIAVYSGAAFRVADLSSRLARRLHIPQVLVLHGGNLPDHARRHPRAVAACLGRAEALVAPSEYLAQRVPAPKPIRVIPNLFDVDGLAFRRRGPAAPRLLWMRTFHPIYNPLLALDVLHLVRARHPEATLTMAGQEKGMEWVCRQRAAELGLGDAVSFPGFLDAKAKRCALIDHDVFLNTNDVDNTPVSVLEAAAAGLPVVATDVGGLSYLLLDGESALLRPAGDAPALADAVDAILTDPVLAGSLSEAGRRVAERSSWSNVRPLWLEVFAGLARARR